MEAEVAGSSPVYHPNLLIYQSKILNIFYFICMQREELIQKVLNTYDKSQLGWHTLNLLLLRMELANNVPAGDADPILESRSR